MASDTFTVQRTSKERNQCAYHMEMLVVNKYPCFQVIKCIRINVTLACRIAYVFISNYVA